MVKLLPGLLLCSRMMSVSSTVVKNKITRQIEHILNKELAPTHLDVINESFDHTGIRPSDQPELASHFRLIVVAPQFENKPVVACHRLVQDALKKEGIYDKVHAIQILTRTPAAWNKSDVTPAAPKCQGGDGRPK